MVHIREKCSLRSSSHKIPLMLSLVWIYRLQIYVTQNPQTWPTHTLGYKPICFLNATITLHCTQGTGGTGSTRIAVVRLQGHVVNSTFAKLRNSGEHTSLCGLNTDYILPSNIPETEKWKTLTKRLACKISTE
jgi:hypothetical protein